MRKADIPVVLTIAGSDSGGEAGIQADLKTFAALNVHGTTAITCLTAQNPKTVSQIESCSPKMLRAQLEAIASYFKPRAAKTGMLYSAELVKEVVRFFSRHKIPLVVDPVITSTSGRSLLEPSGLEILRDELFPLATLITPNLAEAETLIHTKLRSVEEMRGAACLIAVKFGCATLIKGGHLPGTKESIDILFDGKNEWMFSAPRAKNVALHGTGCTYSAAITAWLARGKPLVKAIELAKQFITERIHESKRGLAVRRRSS